MIKNIIAFIASLVFSIAAKIVLEKLVKAHHLPTFQTLSIAIFSSYILMMLSILQNLLVKSKQGK
ncbi:MULTISPECIES: hypothetical protein [Calothrix]|uniref:Uncharacterized protein n=2 Tax=Calothrix TaxID=1186 RepID=A0ABR8AFJ6_9CYAN|nr:MULTISPECIES: hypothetical protein [Calothrix]MBD2197965.1 hypothetical protein [Calothrix parietina FACHB-288]MBD2226750.1 hypothetical protein [Calothrix anomala FACHB-343]